MQKSTDPGDELSKALKKMSLNHDNEWLILHSWAKEFRKENSMSIKEFLKLVEIPFSLTNIQYLSGSGKTKPSKKIGTKGLALRSLLYSAKQNIESMDSTLLEGKINESKLGPSIDNYRCYLEEWLGELRSRGIMKVDAIQSTESQLVIELSVDVGLMREEPTKQSLADLIASFFRNNNLTVPDIVIKDVFCVSQADSRLCIRAEGVEGKGTATIIKVDESMILPVTAKHVVDNNGDEAAVKFFKMKSDIERSFLKDSRSTPLGISMPVLHHEFEDVAVVFCIQDIVNSLTCNHIHGFGSFFFPKVSQVDKLYENFCSSSSSSFVLCKCGAATDVTTAHVPHFSKDRDQFILLRGREVGPVAFHGDSGSVWIVQSCPEEELIGAVIGVTSYIECKSEASNGIQKMLIECGMCPIWRWHTWISETVPDLFEEFHSTD